ncbi:MAG: hypothetical protein F4029_02365 [Gammaproteobacteria bacterium]|nr:hypothetical protein [Gammaproteobacteria bacterium]MXY57757.1 hypothetical protein [Gammaproteobacteria bacterium]MYF27539.1 hypothetical protein [Gammaproteobacteria bacterium]MYK45053.1 hypothetical protein [Gammaproteobacteria bacterium]
MVDSERASIPTPNRRRASRTTKGPRPEAARFQAERHALKKIQVHFEFQQSLMHDIRVAAAQENLSPSDFVRSLVGLSHAEIQRPRISLSFSTADLETLAVRYGQQPDARELKRHVIEEVRRHFAKPQDSGTASR